MAVLNAWWNRQTHEVANVPVEALEAVAARFGFAEINLTRGDNVPWVELYQTESSCTPEQAIQVGFALETVLGSSLRFVELNCWGVRFVTDPEPWLGIQVPEKSLDGFGRPLKEVAEAWGIQRPLDPALT